MKKSDSALERLLRSAARVADEHAGSGAPFGFDTRVVALWRSGNGQSANGILRLVRRVALIAAIVIVVSSAASYHELRETEDTIDSGSNEYAIADTAIENEFYQ